MKTYHINITLNLFEEDGDTPELLHKYLKKDVAFILKHIDETVETEDFMSKTDEGTITLSCNNPVGDSYEVKLFRPDVIYCEDCLKKMSATHCAGQTIQ